jgi:hypothetical protein
MAGPHVTTALNILQRNLTKADPLVNVTNIIPSELPSFARQTSRLRDTSLISLLPSAGTFNDWHTVSKRSGRIMISLSGSTAAFGCGVKLAGNSYQANRLFPNKKAVHEK